jgi:hypothetical protein
MNKKHFYLIILILALVGTASAFMYSNDRQEQGTLERFGDYGEPQSESMEPEPVIVQDFEGEVDTVWMFRTALAKASELEPGLVVKRGQISEATHMLDILESEAEFMYLRDELQDLLMITDEEEMQAFWIELIQEGLVGEWEAIIEVKVREKNM